MAKCPCCGGVVEKRIVETHPALVGFAVLQCVECEWRKVL